MAAIEDIDTNSSRKRIGTMILLSLFGLVSLSMVILILLSVVVPPAMDELVLTYTDAEPEVLPTVKLTEPEKDEIEARVDEFEQALQNGEFVSPLELSERDINGLIYRDDEPSNTYLTIENGTLHAQMSLPIDTDLEIGPWRSSMQGRYINGIAELRLSINDDFLTADLVSFTVKGESVPSWLRSILQREIEKTDWLKSQDVRDVIGHLERIEFQQGRLVLHPK